MLLHKFVLLNLCYCKFTKSLFFKNNKRNEDSYKCLADFFFVFFWLKSAFAIDRILQSGTRFFSRKQLCPQDSLNW